MILDFVTSFFIYFRYLLYHNYNNISMFSTKKDTNISADVLRSFRGANLHNVLDHVLLGYLTPIDIAPGHCIGK